MRGQLCSEPCQERLRFIEHSYAAVELRPLQADDDDIETMEGILRLTA